MTSPPLEKGYSRLVLNIPHAGTTIPPELINACIASKSPYVQDIAQVVTDYSVPYVDYYTDELFSPIFKTDSIETCVFPYLRTICDVERLSHDPLEKLRLGISHFDFRTDCGFRSKMVREWIYKTYWDYQYQLGKQLIRASISNSTLLIDCHSFSSRPTKLCPNPPQDVDICLGYNEDLTKPGWVNVALIKMHFEQKGYRVAINKPFSNSKTVDVPVNYHSLMIEVNKALYMNEDTLEKTEGFANCNQLFRNYIYPFLLRKNKKITFLIN